MFNSEDYNRYLTEHIGNVQKAYQLMLDNNVFDFIPDAQENVRNHDKSKYSEEEYNAYGEYFYGDKKDVPHEEDDAFKKAWLHHLHNNPHHWQYWLLKEDDSTELEALEMPIIYVQEMICDWFSFSISKNDASAIQSWYAENKHNQILHPNTRALVEEYLEKIKGISL